MKGCLWLVLLFLALAAAGCASLVYTPARGSIGLPVLTAFLLTFTLATLWGFVLTVRQWRALRPPVTWADGSLVGFSGRLSAAAPLSAPASGVPAPIYEYSVSVDNRASGAAESSGHRISPGNRMSGQAFQGAGMTACTVQGQGGSFRLVGFPLLAEVAPKYLNSREQVERLATHLLRSDVRPRARGLREALAELRALLDDEDGVVRVDSMGTADIDLAEFRAADVGRATVALTNLLCDRSAVVEERVVPQGAEVTVFGRYRALDRTINVGGGTRDLTHAVKLGAGSRVAAKTVAQAVVTGAVAAAVTGLLAAEILLPLAKNRLDEPYGGRPLTLESILAARIRAEEGADLLVEALNEGDLAKASLLLDLKVDPNRAGAGTMPIDAARDAETLRLVLGAGADPNHVNEYGQTPLHRTAQLPDLSLATVLLDAGADPNRRDSSGATPLDDARANGNEALEALLLQRGAIETEVTSETGGPVPITHEAVSVIAEYLAALHARDVARIKILHPHSVGWEDVQWEPFLENRPASVAACTGYENDTRATIRITGPTASGAPSLTLGFQLERRGETATAGAPHGGWLIGREWVEWPRRTE